MNPEQQTLWSRIEAFEFDAPETRLTFGARLAKENGWSAAYTRAVLLEYKRFLFLTMTAGSPMCPSDAVDQAWHLHLTYTRSYWEDLCGSVLGRPLHHGPTRGGREEDVKHHEMYDRTLAAYRDAFGEDAPEDVWHPAAARFGEDAAFSRVNTRRNWVIAKPRWMKKAAMIAGGVMAVSAAGCFSPMAAVPILDMRGDEFLKFFAFFALGVFAVAAILRSVGRGPAGILQPGDVPDDIYSVATLNGGGTLAVNTAMVELVRREMASVTPSGSVVRISATPPEDLHPFERAVYDGIKGSVCDMKEVRLHVKPWIEGMIEHLRTRALVLENRQIAHLRRQTFWLLLLIPLLGAVKIWIGLSREKPVSFLVIATIVLFVPIVVVWASRPFRTKKGDAVLAKMRRENPRPSIERRAQLASPAVGAGELAMVAALYGTSMALGGTGMSQLERGLTPQNAGSSTGGCSSAGCGGGSSSGGGDGGGGGSSGCGGCGGGGGD